MNYNEETIDILSAQKIITNGQCDDDNKVSSLLLKLSNHKEKLKNIQTEHRSLSFIPRFDIPLDILGTVSFGRKCKKINEIDLVPTINYFPTQCWPLTNGDFLIECTHYLVLIDPIGFVIQKSLSYKIDYYSAGTIKHVVKNMALVDNRDSRNYHFIEGYSISKDQKCDLIIFDTKSLLIKAQTTVHNICSVCANDDKIFCLMKGQNIVAYDWDFNILTNFGQSNDPKGDFFIHPFSTLRASKYYEATQTTIVIQNISNVIHYDLHSGKLVKSLPQSTINNGIWRKNQIIYYEDNILTVKTLDGEIIVNENLCDCSKTWEERDEIEPQIEDEMNLDEWQRLLTRHLSACTYYKYRKTISLSCTSDDSFVLFCEHCKMKCCIYSF